MPADLVVLLRFARSSTLSDMVCFALKMKQRALLDQVDELKQPFLEWLAATHFDFMDRIDAVLAREADLGALLGQRN